MLCSILREYCVLYGRVWYLGGSAADFFYVDHFRKRVVLMRRQDDGMMEPESHPLSVLADKILISWLWRQTRRAGPDFFWMWQN